jgi:integrase
MILGRGSAQTDQDIIAEYHQFLGETHDAKAKTMQSLRHAPDDMQQRIGKPIRDWTDEDIIGLYGDRENRNWYFYSAFLTFLLFRGYRRATLHLLTSVPSELGLQHQVAVMRYRERLEQTYEQLGYRMGRVDNTLKLLVWLLAVVGKPMEELTRADFDTFRAEYQLWYRETSQNCHGWPDNAMYRLERYLVHWGVIPVALETYDHDEYFACVRHQPIRDAVLTYIRWCEAKYQPNTIENHRVALSKFFLWLQEYHPDHSRLDQVTRSVSLEYAGYLKDRVEEGTYSARYRIHLYLRTRLFFEFSIDEGLDSAPDRNPFSLRDMPEDPGVVPRYIPDHELRLVLEYCHNGASLRERTYVTTLLHTGIRSAELSALQSRDIVQIQGKWKLHIREGKGLKDRIIPLTAPCLAILQEWQEKGWERINDYLFTYFGRPSKNGRDVHAAIRELGRKQGIEGLTAHRFRHTFAVALLNYGIRESALQKLMGHNTLHMTLQYARILDRTVEQEFNQAVERMQTGALSWVPNFFKPEDYTLFSDSDAVNWVRLPHGYCRRHPKLQCESDVKCLLCDRYCALPTDLPCLQQMHSRFIELSMQHKASVVAAHVQQLQGQIDASALFLPVLENTME